MRNLTAMAGRGRQKQRALRLRTSTSSSCAARLQLILIFSQQWALHMLLHVRMVPRVHSASLSFWGQSLLAWLMPPLLMQAKVVVKSPLHHALQHL